MTSDTTQKLNYYLKRAQAAVDNFAAVSRETPLVMHAAKQGSAAFTPAMLPKLWQDHPCPYRTPIYKEAWYRGFYSCACWYLIGQFVSVAETVRAGGLPQMFAWYGTPQQMSQWKRVPRVPTQPADRS